MNAITIGIDIGMSGGLAALGPAGGQPPFAVLRMPAEDDQPGQVDVRAVRAWIMAQCAREMDLVIAIERPPEHCPRASSLASLALNYGLLLGMMRATTWPAESVRVVPVSAGNAKDGWQRMLGKVATGQTKAAALAAAQSIWPGMDWIQPGCRVPHDGIIDAALIAEFTRRQAL